MACMESTLLRGLDWGRMGIRSLDERNKGYGTLTSQHNCHISMDTMVVRQVHLTLRLVGALHLMRNIGRDEPRSQEGVNVRDLVSQEFTRRRECPGIRPVSGTCHLYLDTPGTQLPIL
uniref:Uncharacterized protein n=1 Tax=Cacopsylla melanoneura TaxID=428564 RepID=A0A8D8YXT8_9HEMI